MDAGGWDDVGLPIDETVSYQQLRASGLSRRAIDDALAENLMVRARRDVYLSATASDRIVRAQRVGGRLDCVSALRERGVFVLDDPGLHVQVDPTDARLRSPTSRRERWTARTRRGVTVHWHEVDAPRDVHTVPVVNALAQSALCQRPRPLIASIDSALNLKLMQESDLDSVFALLPMRLQPLRTHIDGRAQAGSETFARLVLRAIGTSVEVQKVIDGVGIVDLVVDGWLVIECDSREFHGGWPMQERDRARDLALAARGYTCIRPTANMIFQAPELLIAAVQGLLAARVAR